MPLETATYISDLVSSNPVATDQTKEGDDHIRLIKAAAKATLPGLTGALTRTIGGSYGTLHGDGSPTVPGIAFALEPTLGWYRNIAGSATFTGNLGVVGLFAQSVTSSGAGTFGGAGSFVGGVTAAAFSSSGPGSFGAVSGSTGFFSGAVTSSASFTAPAGNFTTLTAATVIGALPAGSIMDFAYGAAPTGWLACDGGAISRATYATLFSRMGTTWGAGDGSTTFNVPNFVSRYRRHRDNGGTLAGFVGNLQNPANVSHTHGYSGTSDAENRGHTHTYNSTTGGQSVGHTHTYSSTSGSTNTDHGHAFNVTSGTMSANATHSHALGSAQNAFLTSINNGTATSQGNVMVTVGSVSANLTTSAVNTDHSHNVAGNTGGMSVNTTHTHSVTGTTDGVSSDHSHGVSGTTSDINQTHTHAYSGTTAASGDANETRPYSATVLTCIKLFD